MSYNNYLLNLANISNEIGYSLTYGYGDIAATEINFLKALIAKSEEMIPILEAEACFNEAEELDREDRSFNYWMTMLYGKGDVISPMDSHSSSKANRLNRRKQNKKNKSRDRIHGRRHGGAHGGIDFRYVDCNPFCNKHQYEDAMFWINGKHRHNADRKASAMKAREQEYYSYASYLAEKAEQEAEAAAEAGRKAREAVYTAFGTLPENGKFLVLHSYWNGEFYEEEAYGSNEFHNIMSKEGIRKLVMDNVKEFEKEAELEEVELSTEFGLLKGIKFLWEKLGGYSGNAWNYYSVFPLN